MRVAFAFRISVNDGTLAAPQTDEPCMTVARSNVTRSCNAAAESIRASEDYVAVKQLDTSQTATNRSSDKRKPLNAHRRCTVRHRSCERDEAKRDDTDA